jgi:hypothetical protein
MPMLRVIPMTTTGSMPAQRPPAPQSASRSQKYWQ